MLHTKYCKIQYSQMNIAHQYAEVGTEIVKDIAV